MGDSFEEKNTEDNRKISKTITENAKNKGQLHEGHGATVNKSKDKGKAGGKKCDFLLATIRMKQKMFFSPSG